MDEFREIADNLTTAHFENLSKITANMTVSERARYAEKFPIRIFTCASVDPDNLIHWSAN